MMIAGIPLNDLIFLAVSLIAAGAVTGLLAGLFGVGGGAVIVPVLYEVFRVIGVPEEVRMPLVVGTSLAVIIPTSIRSYRAHLAKGLVDTSIIKIWAVPVVLGVLGGSFIARYAPPDVFKAVFVAVAFASAMRLLFASDRWKLGDDMPGPFLMRIYGVIIGILSALMGIGGGQLSSLFMTFYGRPIHQAVATSSGLGVLISIPGALGYIYAGWPKMDILPPLSLGYVSFIGFLLFIPTSIWTAPIGARLAHRLSKRRLEVAFGIFLLVVCARFFWSLIA
ncbi:putative membrane transporter protein [Bosea sp. 62]|nr:putative membrane transporter protein [Bosea sp. 7B]CAD5300311.1 putative membrane transporter protein [Bosea sp. 21B]CAD5300869.1 putative membrane transporter protein [Bosea sp. 46]VVT62012.1 putative membrane transporter protein [Bosea sp. EC-HK365B]VXB50299.1 putative membrane transporter protein [Bosea sp. 125]VXC73307.1 putative membrane transporter protein [Bosea sp. 62]VXC92718.1 putative membrane transporter protein [Bosea sp. 29B]VXC97784.1 putative membrane transporter protein 